MIDPCPDDPEDDAVREDELRKIGALIRANFHVDPFELEDQQFIQLAQEAVWIEKYREARQIDIYNGLIHALLGTVK